MAVPKTVKVLGALSGTVALIGTGVLGWNYLYPTDAAEVDSKGGMIAIGNADTPRSESSGSLQVSSPAEVAASGGGATNLLGGSSKTTPPNREDTASSPKSAPGPSKFHQYDVYQNNKTALFGDLRVGDGLSIEVGSTAIVSYRGWLTNGTLFDENYSTGKAFSFKEGEHRVIPGWEEAMMGMKVGGKRRLIVPPSRGYGFNAQGAIPGNSVLVFDVELVAIQ